jgi:predicted acylesterase/phospholipase RssA
MQQPKLTPGMKTVTVILSGAVTKGAFEAGVLKILAERGIVVRRIVASSSGALNGTAYAAGVRARRETVAVEELIAVWKDEGSWRDVLHFNGFDILRGKGLSDQQNLLALLRRNIKPSGIPDPAPIELHIIVSPLCGAQGSIGPGPATTYTKVLSFDGAYFDRRDLLEQVFTATTASSAFPYVFTPVEVPGVGPCIDGALVNSTPIRAIGDDRVAASVDAIVVIAPTPTCVGQRRTAHHGRKLVVHVINMIFNERLYNDMRETAATNTALLSLDAEARRRQWGPEERAEVRAALGWQDKRAVRIIPIRPLSSLPGDLFSGFFSAQVRRRYIEIGMERASRVLDQLGWC